MITTHHMKEFPVKGADIHLYCGRMSSWHGVEGMINVHLGNDHPIGYCRKCKRQHDREDAIQSYLGDLPVMTKKQLAVIDRIALRHREGKHIALYCFCKPHACHTDEIKRMIEWEDGAEEDRDPEQAFIDRLNDKTDPTGKMRAFFGVDP